MGRLLCQNGKDVKFGNGSELWGSGKTCAVTDAEGNPFVEFGGGNVYVIFKGRVVVPIERENADISVFFFKLWNNIFEYYGFFSAFDTDKFICVFLDHAECFFILCGSEGVFVRDKPLFDYIVNV